MAKITYEGKQYPLFEGEDALRGLMRGGASVAYSCRKGTCQTCMLHAVSGDPGEASKRGMREELRSRGYFLPCIAHPAEDVVATRPDPSALSVRMHVQQKSMVAADVARLLLEPETNFTAKPGQFVNVARGDGASRSYSIASVIAEDYFVELHVRRTPSGSLSPWLVDDVSVGDVLTVDGPHGECVWDASEAGALDRPLLLIGTGTGLAPLWAIARAALFAGHRGGIALFHGARERSGLYLHRELELLAREHERFTYTGCVSAKSAGELEGVFAGRALDAAKQRHSELEGWAVYLAGLPAMVHDARRWAVSAGVDRAQIKADPFEFAGPIVPEDDRKLASVEPDLDLWNALEQGAKLRAILEDFYTIVYADPRLAPFFHRVTKDHAVGKQYSFLADLFTGRHDYFGLKPFNAHHWMVISDELFDYRERLICAVMREHGLSEAHVRRWTALHELFRREMVKSAPRGLIVDGVEHEPEKITDEKIEVATLCDGCHDEMPEGSTGRLLWRTGELFCSKCAAKKRASAVPPPGA
jgi:NAD(P)H-flavin reductase/truncated hemoglobin YjbI/ferredoxin